MDTKKLIFIIIAAGIAGMVLWALVWANVGLLNLTGYFEKHDIYKDSIVLFFHNECPYCTKVDTYVNNNAIEKKVPLVRLNILDNDYNRNELADKVQTCGLDIKKIGVPFLWDGQGKKCYVGYIDIIEFFRKKALQRAK